MIPQLDHLKHLISSKNLIKAIIAKKTVLLHLKIGIKETIITYSRQKIDQIPLEDFIAIINDVHLFNLKTRSFNLRNPKK